MATGDVRRLIDMIKNQDGEGSGLDADLLRQFSPSQNPQANQIPVLNSNGQLPLPFTQTPILVNGQDMMRRTFYVDAENGDDNNDGSSSAPFKTLQKTISSVPSGGYCGIYLKDGTYIIDNYIILNNQNIVINCSLVTNSANISFLTRESHNKERPYNIYIQNSHLRFYGYNKCSIETPGLSLGLGDKINEGVFLFVGNGLVDFYQCTISVNEFYLVSGYVYQGYLNIIAACFSDNIIVKNGSSNVIDARKLLIHSSVNDDIRDSDNNNLAWSDVIDAIVKDANGNPRNIISNIVF